MGKVWSVAVAGFLASGWAMAGEGRWNGKGRDGSGPQERGCCGCNCRGLQGEEMARCGEGKAGACCACQCVNDGQALPPCEQPGRGGSGSEDEGPQMQRNIPDRMPSTVPQVPEDRGGSAVSPGNRP